MASVLESPTFRETAIAAHDWSTDALMERGDALAFDATDPDPDFPGEVGRLLAGERLRAIEAELQRRARLAAAHPALPRPDDARLAAWRELARLVRELDDIIEVFTACGYHLHDVGPREAHSSCLVCGGSNRLVIRRDPPGRVWCRQCRWSGDVITVAMSLRRSGFRDGLSWLAELAGATQVAR